MLAAGQDRLKTEGPGEEFTIKGAKILGEDVRIGSGFVQRPLLFDFGKTSGIVVWGQPFFDAASVPKSLDSEEVEFKAAINLADPVA